MRKNAYNCRTVYGFGLGFPRYKFLVVPKVSESKSKILEHDLRLGRSQVEDQSQTNSCCANAVAGAYEYINKRYAMSKGGAGGIWDLMEVPWLRTSLG